MSIQCSAISCAHNKNNLCFANAIIVENNNSAVSQQTACATFTKTANEGFNEFVSQTNSGDNPCSNIGCKAQCCAYNENEHCLAGSIVVNGESACDYHQTSCETFKIR